METRVAARDGLPDAQTYYPGVMNWRQSTELVVEEGKSINDVQFRLPEFGGRRRVSIQVMDEDGIPVPGAAVSDNGAECAKIGEEKRTGTDGQVILSLYRSAQYCLNATLWLPRFGSYSGGQVIPANTSPVRQVIVLKGYHSRKAGPLAIRRLPWIEPKELAALPGFWPWGNA